MHSEPPVVSVIRRSSRLMVRELGFMASTLASTNYSPSAVHTLVEIALRKEMTAGQLVQLLGLEKSSVSRMLARLIAAGELEEVVSTEDARTKSLRLTGKGRDTVNKINAYSNERVVSAIQSLQPAQQQIISQGLSLYANALLACRETGVDTRPDELKIVQGYLPGMIGRIAEMHGSYYAREHNFGRFFEAKVASGLAEFSGRLDKPCNQIWLAVLNDRIVGSVAIDGEDLEQGEAHLRWFIIDDGCRGHGAGKKLLNEAILFCDSVGFSAVHLWTFNKLTTARRLYESFGFTLAKEWEGDQWGSLITEQQFTRRRDA
ncbi:helix-turn-helix domain-containing GNAT family N-acetyltransferase [Enterobacter cloacae]|uniref:bifunctional helix-turn-helix transcriptional regulator/GNAT family N-acetyltransferase n=1 Tax=Enterobacter cloacae complex TaxID=354276 RepID=UPI000E4BD40C|nr:MULTISPECIES: helix-turn-helix domain-containing GNAT family N-acetyltransferase [Enterobacter cloacae complex]ELR9130844.1 MarR family transcriptional regulator [Enterobacter cloacae]MCR1554316.1 helix-turn-helix domain-containing GNAT family N-acetyltransferase [Enterobacter cloacae]MCR6728117.1 helix-turn-helix domain-containing GNAT family N-acetyltransferase [Enterobacter cloacae]MCU6200278.1 helix-turn-helix domain-containing GNAT family N-acetyltransferase [Enterobacter cloacae]MCU62